MKSQLVQLFSFLTLLVFTMPSLGNTVYSNDFDNPAVASGGVTDSLTGGEDKPSVAPYNVTYGNFRRSNSNSVPIELTLTNLPPHSEVDLNFLMAFLDSWDSYDGACCTPDRLDLYVDQNLLATYTYNQALGTIKDIDGGSLLLEYVQFDANQFHSDVLVDMSGDPALKIPHSSSSLVIDWIASGDGWQGGDDEAFGIDSISIDVEGVPEPSSLLLALASGIGAFSIRSRRFG